MLIDTTQLALERSISGAAQRHEALAANIANASTPGYRRVDVDFHGALAAALGSSDAMDAVAATSFATQADATVGATQADGNPQRDTALGHGCRVMSMFEPGTRLLCTDLSISGIPGVAS